MGRHIRAAHARKQAPVGLCDEIIGCAVAECIGGAEEIERTIKHQGVEPHQDGLGTGILLHPTKKDRSPWPAEIPGGSQYSCGMTGACRVAYGESVHPSRFLG